MKSLEIINKEIELIHNQLNDYDEEDEEYGFYPSYDTLIYELNNYNQIKQDLDVLEIIKIKNVNLYSIKGFLNMHKKRTAKIVQYAMCNLHKIIGKNL